MKISRHFIYIIGLFLFSCSPTYTLQLHEEKVIGIQAESDSSIIAIISPYQNSIEEQMNEVLTYSKNDLEKGRPQSTIGNFVTDLCLKYAEANICVMNNGGFRTTLVKGEITRGDIYKLMPFENELVVLELDTESFKSLLDYIVERGEPFSGMKFEKYPDRYHINEIKGRKDYFELNKGKKIKVLTSDYLANGGDRMKFFKDKKQKKVGIKLRDAIIDYCNKIDTIDVKLDDRIKIISNE